jgi:uncharacterized alkaline shock family protein YloU
MPLIKNTDLGEIIINDNVIAKAILRSTLSMSDKMFLSTKKARIIGQPTKIRSGDLVGHFVIKETPEKYILKFYIIMSFGSSIRQVTDTVLSALEKEMRAMFPEKNGRLTIKIVGVKSTYVAERDIEVVRVYEAGR